MAHILLVEDDEAVRAFVSRALTLDGHNITEACDGEEGFDELQASLHAGTDDFDLMLTDIKMPFMDGIELTTHANTLFPDMPVVMMTGYADQRENAAHLEVVEIVAKPFSLADIRACITATLAPPLQQAG